MLLTLCSAHEEHVNVARYLCNMYSFNEIHIGKALNMCLSNGKNEIAIYLREYISSPHSSQ